MDCIFTFDKPLKPLNFSVQNWVFLEQVQHVKIAITLVIAHSWSFLDFWCSYSGFDLQYVLIAFLKFFLILCSYTYFLNHISSLEIIRKNKKRMKVNGMERIRKKYSLGFWNAICIFWTASKCSKGTLSSSFYVHFLICWWSFLVAFFFFFVNARHIIIKRA